MINTDMTKNQTKIQILKTSKKNLKIATNHVAKGNGEPCDIAAYDAEKCLNALWAQECVNDLWDTGCRDDKLSLLHMENQAAQVVIKHSGNKTDPVNMSNFIVQGV